jgi:hypothetical protein
MASAATVRRLWLLDNPQLRKELFNKRRVGVHDINRSRAVFGEFHHLFKELRQDSVRFFEFFAYVRRNIRLHFIKRKTPITEEIY